MRKFLKTTIVGGAVFLLPLVIILMLLGSAVGFAIEVVKPFLDEIGLDPTQNVGGIGVVTLVAVLVLVILCFIAGLLARTTVGDWFTNWVERSILGRMPQYQMMKSMAAAYGELESGAMEPCLVSIEGGWQVGYLIETLENGWKVVFMPQAPTPMSGNIMYFLPERVRPVDLTMIQATRIISRLGIGSTGLLKTADMQVPEGQ